MNYVNDGDNNHSVANISNDQIDIINLILFFWARKLLLIILTTIGVVLSVLYSLSIPNKYESNAILSPSASFQSDSNLGMFNYSGAASLAGISLPSSQGSNSLDLVIEILNSRDFYLRFVKSRNISVDLIATIDWDNKTRQLKYDEEIYDIINSEWVARGSSFTEEGPTSQTIIDFMSELIFIKKDIETGFVRISVKHYSPDIAKKWLEWIIEDINKTLKNRDLVYATKTKAYLLEQIEKNKIAELNQVFNDLVAAQIEKIMLAEVQDEYALTVIDPPLLPERKSEPNRVKIVLFGSVLSGLLSMILVFFHSILHSRKRKI